MLTLNFNLFQILNFYQNAVKGENIDLGVDNCCHVLIRAPVIDTLEITKIVNEYDQEIPQSQTADNPVAP